jgi:predicted RNA-binding Zn ribbon-like protein
MTEFRSGNGAAWLDLLSTLNGRYRDRQVDAVGTPQQLRAWLAGNGLAPVEAVTDEDVAATGRVREALHRTTLAAIDRRRPATDDAAVLEEALSYDAPLRVQPASDGLRVDRPRTAREGLARLVRDAVTLLAGDEIVYLHRCGDEACSSIYLDRTGRRRWCTDLSCGNRARVRAHRARSGSST